MEIEINEDIDNAWEATQQPELHEQWDLRFSSITYLPKEENEPQHFSYKTNISPFLKIEGWGKSVGSHHATDGSKTSSLHFGTDQAISIIKEGRGYWKYIPNDDDTLTFLTQYNYETNFGRLGRWFDKALFRPLIGWATALSFDVLKRWLEKGETPPSQYIRFFSSGMIALLFFFVWTYHGLIPKLIHMHRDEIMMIQSGLSLTLEQATWVVIALGITEVMFGIIWLLYRKKRHLFGIQLVIFPLLTIAALVADPSQYAHPFTPITLNAALFVLSMVGWLVSKDIPTAKSCHRQRRGE